MSELTKAMLSVQTAPGVQNRAKQPTTTVEVKGDEATVEFPRQPGENTDTAAYRYLESKGESPEDWVVTGFRSSEWTMANGEVGESMRYTFARRGSETFGSPINVEETLAWLESERREPPRAYEGGSGDPKALLFLIGDMQFGKMDGDGVDGTLKRFVDYVNQAIDRAVELCRDTSVAEVVIAFMGDHGEGFVSQGGANVWRTTLTNSEQLRLTRRAMSYAVEQFARCLPVGIPLHVVAVPGNHGETIRLAGKGTTKYSDSWDTEALVAVADALALTRDAAYRRVKTYVPTDDEMVVVLDVAGTRAGFLHGHQHRAGKHFDWLAGQAFDKGNPLRDVDLLVEGHLHHFHVDTRNGVTFIGVPAVESESTWFRHRTGITGDPGAVLALTGNGETRYMEVIQ